MEIKIKVTKIGSSYFLLIPKSYIDVFKMSNWIDEHNFNIFTSDDGKTITYKRVRKSKKEIDEDKDKANQKQITKDSKDTTQLKGGKRKK